jgi:hypothetical protein
MHSQYSEADYWSVFRNLLIVSAPLAISLSVIIGMPMASNAQTTTEMHSSQKLVSKPHSWLRKSSRNSKLNAADKLEVIAFEKRPVFRDGWGSFERKITSKHRLPAEKSDSSFRFGFSTNDENLRLSQTRLESAPELGSLAMSPGIFPPLSSAQRNSSKLTESQITSTSGIAAAYQSFKRECSLFIDLIIETSGSLLKDLQKEDAIEDVALSPYDDLRRAIRQIAPNKQASYSQEW